MLNIFFMDFDLELTDVSLENKYTQYILEMREKYKDLDMEEVMFKKRNEKREEEIKEYALFREGDCCGSHGFNGQVMRKCSFK